ncbi:tetratricopeptide repeat-containing sulfotransferase family protein [Phenylobacterium sp.]|uniref:tetratricopeptide repeat-containing sulfotransferase family protein n=1 Tax=Phenylobacterium sp. TaxID=1871053 RepID=UPI002E33D804|nr:sulfotransferase [Phenylobacterium sp.]HEX3367915.1 sulfotransferase [Phenylobacterium sp.]
MTEDRSADAAIRQRQPEAPAGTSRGDGFGAALAQAEHDVRRAPRDAAAWSRLAEALLAVRRAADALAAWDRALALAPETPGRLCGKGRAFQSLGRPDAAEAAYRRALALEPERFDAAFNLSVLAADAGRWAEAERRVAPLHVRYPDTPALLWLAARVALGRGDMAVAHDRLAALSRDPRLGAEQRADTLLMLAEALDGLGRRAEAFEAVVAGKAIQRRLFADRAAARETAVGRFERIAAWFRTTDPAPWRTAPKTSAAPGRPAVHAFLVGFPRSGTTLLEQALAGHPSVKSLEEAPTLAAAHAEFMSSPEGLARLARLSAAEAELWRARYWAEVAAHGVDNPGQLFLDKAPAGTVDLPLMAKLFPEARILFAVRDPRDVALSCLRNNFQLNAMTFAFTDLQETAACYDASMALAEIYRGVLPSTWLDVRHESLIADFEPGLAAICAFLGLEPDAAMLDVGATSRARSVRTPSARQVRAGLNQGGVGRWRSYERELGPVLPVLAPWVDRFGYRPG